MTDTKQLLERAGRIPSAPAFDLETLRQRRDRRARSERIRAGAVGLGLVAAVVVGVIATLAPHERGRSDAVALGDALPAAREEPLVAGPGEYYHRAILIGQRCVGASEVCVGNDVGLDATYWWSPADDSGRIAVDDAHAYGIEAGRFGPGAFPNHNGIDVSAFPIEPPQLAAFLLERSAEDGASPAPIVTPPPEGAPEDGRLWRAITDLLQDPHVTPAVRAALLEVAARLQGSHVTLDATDPFGRPAEVVAFGNWGGDILEQLYVDPRSHELLCWTSSAAGADLPFYYFVVQQAGVVDSTESGLALDEGSVPGTLLSTEDLRFGE